MEGPATGDEVYGKLHSTGNSIELTNNYYESGVRNNSAKQSGVTGSDVAP